MMRKRDRMTNRKGTMRKLLLATAVLSFVAVSAFAQTGQTTNPVSGATAEGPKPSSLFLLDPSRFKIGHTISTSYASLGGHGVLTSMYLADIQYKLANPLDIRVSLGFANSQGSLFGPRGSANSIIPGFELNYHPSKNFNLIINYQQYPNGYLQPRLFPLYKR